VAGRWRQARRDLDHAGANFVNGCPPRYGAMIYGKPFDSRVSDHAAWFREPGRRSVGATALPSPFASARRRGPGRIPIPASP